MGRRDLAAPVRDYMLGFNNAAKDARLALPFFYLVPTVNVTVSGELLEFAFAPELSDLPNGVVAFSAELPLDITLASVTAYYIMAASNAATGLPLPLALAQDHWQGALDAATARSPLAAGYVSVVPQAAPGCTGPTSECPLNAQVRNFNLYHRFEVAGGEGLEQYLRQGAPQWDSASDSVSLSVTVDAFGTYCNRTLGYGDGCAPCADGTTFNNSAGTDFVLAGSNLGGYADATTNATDAFCNFAMASATWVSFNSLARTSCSERAMFVKSKCNETSEMSAALSAISFLNRLRYRSTPLMLLIKPPLGS
jgi:hypothetical protein